MFDDLSKKIITEEMLMGMLEATGRDVEANLAECNEGNDDFGMTFSPTLLVLYASPNDKEFDYDILRLSQYADSDENDAFNVGEACFKAGYDYTSEYGMDHLPAVLTMISYGKYAQATSEEDMERKTEVVASGDDSALSECITIFVATFDRRLCAKVYEIVEASYDTYEISDVNTMSVSQMYDEDMASIPLFAFFGGVQVALAEKVVSGDIKVDTDALRSAAAEYKSSGAKMSPVARALLDMEKGANAAKDGTQN